MSSVPFLTDARFLHLFPYKDPENHVVYWDEIHTMAAVYRALLGSSYRGGGGGGGGVSGNIPSVSELTQLCHTLHKMNFIASVYLTKQLRSFSGEGPAAAPPSHVERQRVLPALYQRQIVCNAWAPTRREPRWSNNDTAAIGNTSEHQGVRLGHFAAFEPWELQQVDHVDYFITRLCASLCLVREEAREPMNEAEFGEIFSHLDCLVTYMQEHLSIADAALRPRPSPPPQSEQDALDIIPVYISFLQRYPLLCLTSAWQSQRLLNFPDPARDKPRQQL